MRNDALQENITGNIKEPSNIPAHIAIIPDGNRRWAKERNLPAMMGHKKGAEIFEDLADKARELGVKCMTAWVFSTENWKRSKDEVDYMFDLVREYMKKYTKKCMDEKIRFVHLGRKDRLPKDIVEKIIELEQKTKDFIDFTVAIAADFGGVDELLRAIKKVVEQKLEITRENITSNLDTANIPPLDLIIRTGGEYRLSGFMTWENEYAELAFPKQYLPDFGPKELELAIADYGKRERRFGGDSKKY